MAFTSDENTAPFLLVQAEAHLIGKDAPRNCRVVQVTDHTHAYVQINWERLLASVVCCVSAALTMQIKSKDFRARKRYAY